MINAWELRGSEIIKSNKVILEAWTGDCSSEGITFILGPNGGGKSTLMKQICALESPRAEIHHLGSRIPPTPQSMARALAFLPSQEPEDLWLPVYKVISLGRYAFEKYSAKLTEDFFEVLKALDIESLLDRDFSTLSLGQKRRVSIARVLFQNTPLVLFDEPSSALDLGHREAFWDLIRTLSQKERHFIICLHDLNEALDLGGGCWILSDGKIVTRGNLTEVLTPQVLQSIWGLKRTDSIFRK